MQSVVALCHFCEMHGPKIIFSSQAFHSSEIDVVTDFYQQRQCSEGRGSTSECCTACSWFAQQNFFLLSDDPSRNLIYASTPCPVQSCLFSLVRQACVRSLSCEVYPSQQDPIFFGDDVTGHTVSFPFTVDDIDGRGFSSKYSFIVFMTSQVDLLGSWLLLRCGVSKLIKKLQTSAADVYLRHLHDMKQRSSSSSPPSYGRGSQVRSLVELTGIAGLGEYLHGSFVWLLQVSALHLRERFILAPPEAKLAPPEAKLAPPEAKLAPPEAKFSSPEAKFSSPEAKLSSPEARLATTSCASGSDGKIQCRCATGSEGKSCRGGAFGLKNLRLLIGQSGFTTLSYYVFTGRGVGIQASCPLALQSLRSVLARLLPYECSSEIAFAESKHCAHLTVLESGGFELVVPEELPDKLPTIVRHFKQLTDDEKLTDCLLDETVKVLKQEWLSKTKVFFEFTRSGRSMSDQLKLLRILNATEEDHEILNFWVSGLSDEFRSKITQSSNTARGNSH